MSKPRPRSIKPTLRGATLGAALWFVAGCGAVDDLLDVDLPSQIAEDTFLAPQNAARIVNGAISDFECMLSMYVVAGGLVGDELVDGQLNNDMADYDRRSFNPASGLYAIGACPTVESNLVYVYPPLSTARYQADQALRLLDGWTDAQVPNRSTLMAIAAAYAGYSYVLLGEGFCSAAIDVGPELTPADLFALAEERFTRSLTLAQTAGVDSIQNLALVGRARARLNLGRGADAAIDAAQVPDGFRYSATYSATQARRINWVYQMNAADGYLSVEDDFRNLEFAGVPDPRVTVVDAGSDAFDGQTPLWTAQKYTSASSPIAIATATEARLIEAEVHGGQTAVGIINDLHDAVGLPPFSSTDATEIRRQVIEERRREFFLDGHHLGDVIRYQLPLTPAAGAPYPKGGSYGNQVCFPLPDVERNNNPNLSWK
jgi:starch-binding outer membrane protein, SusD/RagB family